MSELMTAIVARRAMAVARSLRLIQLRFSSIEGGRIVGNATLVIADSREEQASDWR